MKDVNHLEANEKKHRFDMEGKSREWHTAFYYLAEHIRYLSKGEINHKALYSLVGTDGRFVNHSNPLVRKRTAGALSRLVHSKQYAEDMRRRYDQNSASFDKAASEVVAQIRETRLWSDDELVSYLRDNCWIDVRRGLKNELVEWRSDLSLFRVDQEMGSLFADISYEFDLNRETCDATVVLSVLFYIVAFGHMDFDLARHLVDKQPTGVVSYSRKESVLQSKACLIKFSDTERSSVVGSWIVSSDRPFTIGRYTDCDIVEVDSSLSRLHCCLYFRSGVWYFEDMGSRNGSVVMRDETVVYDQVHDGAHEPIALQHGDGVVLADCVRYWFGAFEGDEEALPISFH